MIAYIVARVIPVLSAADENENRYSATNRTGISPAPSTLDKCCKHLIINCLHNISRMTTEYCGRHSINALHATPTILCGNNQNR